MSDLKIILDWPIVDLQNGHYVALGLGLAAAYWWGGGLPGQGQSMMVHAQSYLLGGAVNWAYFQFIEKTPPRKPRHMRYGPGPVFGPGPSRIPGMGHPYGPGPIISPVPAHPKYSKGPVIHKWDPPM